MGLGKQFCEQIVTQRYWKKDDTVIVGVSGGVDSMVLFDLLYHLPENYRPIIHVAYINHKLRQESDAEEHFIKEYMKKRSVPVHVYIWDKKDHPTSGIEQEARKIRYQFFSDVAKEINSEIILTAHHFDDQVETILMRFIRGNSLDELTGISVERMNQKQRIIRPLLPYKKECIKAHAEQRKIPWKEDESNQLGIHTRNRYRNEIIPKLEQENPAVKAHIHEFSEDIKDLLSALKPLVEEEIKRSFKITESGMTVNLTSFSTIEKGFQKIVLSKAFKKMQGANHFAVSQHHIKLLLDWFKTGGPNTQLDLPEPLIARKEYDRCIIENRENVSQKNRVVIESEKLEINQWKKLSETEKIGWFEREVYQQSSNQNAHCLYLEKESVKEPLFIRHRKAGDRMKVKGLNGSKKIKDIFIDQKVPTKKRQDAWLVTDEEDTIVWLVGYKESPLSLNPLTDTITYVLIYQNTSS
ncbi:tRNA lysidine(34) synthetase TilS [Alkalibacterium gilvum]|uniref:tRNA lysidine(34) synthetase TilS n=1 Tax=Alkalibacterium gilvum TaxID=1130080 RepID=UPI003F8F900D